LEEVIVPGTPGEQEIGDWLAGYVGELLARPAAEIDRDTAFGSFGLDSATAIGITGELEEWLGIGIDPEAAEEYPTIRLLGQHLAARVAARRTAM
jgi:acyl carrier protein